VGSYHGTTQEFVAGRAANIRISLTRYLAHVTQNLFAYVNIYVVAVPFTKLSIVMFYRRLFAPQKIT
jgi:hypothetical protein